MIPKTAFILGNGPSLPVDRLDALAGQFTIGINRILRSGFVPTVIVWSDLTVYKEEKRNFDECGALLVTGKGIKDKPHHIGLTFSTTRNDNQDPTQLYIKGNTGTGAARWASALGVEKIFLLGMGANYDEGRTDFYGKNRYHGVRTLEILQRQLVSLKSDYNGRVLNGDDPRDWILSPEQNQSKIRTEIIYWLKSEGIDFDYASNAKRGRHGNA